MHHKVRTSGTYQIDVDGEGPLRPIWVDCEMGDGRELFQVLTIVHHDLEETLQVRGKEPPGSYSRNVTYGDATERHLTRLIDSMFSCQQLVRWDCKGAMFGFWYPPGLDSWCALSHSLCRPPPRRRRYACFCTSGESVPSRC